MLIPFTVEHLECMTVKADAKAVAASAGTREALVKLAGMGMSRTLISDSSGTVLGVFGAVPTVPGVCEVFILASADQKRFPIIFAKSVRKELYTLKGKFRRIQAVSKNDDFHARWLSWLGFEKEGTMRRYGVDGEDMVMWGFV